MDIKGVEDLKKVIEVIHDSEFNDKDLKYDPQKRVFSLTTWTSDRLNEFVLDIYNVEEYKPINLDKVNKGQATGGVFNDIAIKDEGLNLEIISQDLRIKLRLSKLGGSFIQVSRRAKGTVPKGGQSK